MRCFSSIHEAGGRAGGRLERDERGSTKCERVGCPLSVNRKCERVVAWRVGLVEVCSISLADI